MFGGIYTKNHSLNFTDVISIYGSMQFLVLKKGY